MRLHRFYTKQDLSPLEPQSVVTITHEEGAEQWRKVFRFVAGDRVIMFDGSGRDYVAEILEYKKDVNGMLTALITIVDIRENNIVSKRETWLCGSIVKKDTFEWIVEKATELGVIHIVPILAERSEKKNLNTERLHKIMIESSEQSGRGTVPKLHDMMSLEEMIDYLKVEAGFSTAGQDGAPEIIAWEPTARLFSDAQPNLSSKVACLIGPEGGWSPAELQLMKEKGVAIYSMGPQILRAETAVVAALSLVTFL